ncbi:MAG: pyruvate kinase [Candidatus Shapirobacteria bacterium]
MIKKTKIIATIGPASESNEAIEKLIHEGVNLFRFNLKHNVFQWHKDGIERVNKIAEKLGKNIGVFVDFQGPEIRLETPNEEELEVKDGESIFISKDFIKGKKSIRLNPVLVLPQIEIGDEAFIDDGDLDLKIIGKSGDVLEARVGRDYVIKNRKSMNIPGKDFDLPLFADRDLDVLEKIDQLEIDFVALSFVRTAEDVLTLKKELIKNGSKAKIISKIENDKAIKNLEEIISVSDGIMIARGDLGIEIPIKELAYWQKKIIDLCRRHSTPVIVATQMLQSMVENYTPTRAEATDVSNAIFDGSDALMLSEETAMGKYPVKVVTEMASIANFCENHGLIKEIPMDPKNLTEVLVNAAVKIVKGSKDFPIKAVVVFTESGNTARILSRYRLKIPVIAITDNEETVKILSLSYGINPHYKKFRESSFKSSNPIFSELLKFDFIKEGDNVLMIHGNNWMDSGSTSDISLVTL